MTNKAEQALKEWIKEAEDRLTAIEDMNKEYDSFAVVGCKGLKFEAITSVDSLFMNKYENHLRHLIEEHKGVLSRMDEYRKAP